MSAEAWRPVPFTTGYEVSDRGAIRSHRPCRALPVPRLLHPTSDPRGYQVLNLMMPDGKPRLHRVHQVVLAAFVGPMPDDCSGARHLNDHKDDNRLENLAWGDHAENMADRVRNGIHHWSKRDHCKRGHAFTPENTRFRVDRTGRVCIACCRERSRKHKQKQAIETRQLRAA